MSITALQESALAYSQYKLIDDELFVDTGSMSVSEIQAFLDNQGGFLANWKDDVNIPFPGKKNGVGKQCLAHKATGATAAQIIHQAATDWQAKYVVWRKPNGDVIPASQWATYSGTIQSCRNETAKWPSYGLKTVSSKVLLATLQKEQSIVNAGGSYSLAEQNYNDPDCNYGGGECTNNNYKLVWAMGYGYPDSGKLNYRFTGFYNQIHWASWQFRFNFERSAAVQNTNCGASNLDNTQTGVCWDDVEGITYGGPMIDGTYVRSSSHSPQIYAKYWKSGWTQGTANNYAFRVDNQATASLYYYTPHACNSGCGNANFVSIYESWFGPTILSHDVRITSSLASSPDPSISGQNVTATFTIKNYENEQITMNGTLLVAARDPDGKWVDFPSVYDVVIPAKGTYTYSKTRSFDKIGDYRLWIRTNRVGFGWSDSYPGKTNSSIVKSVKHTVKKPNLLVTSSLSSVSDPSFSGENVTASFVIKNYESIPITLNGIMRAAGRDPGGRWVNFPPVYDTIIPAKGTFTYSKTRSFEKPGNYRIYIETKQWGGDWSTIYPGKTNSSIVKSVKHTVEEPNIRVTTGLSSNPQSSSSGQDVTASFVIKNYENESITLRGTLWVAARDPSGQWVDFPSVYDVIIPAKGTYTYIKSRKLTKPGKYKMWIKTNRDGYGHSDTYPSGTNSSIKKLITHTVI